MLLLTTTVKGKIEIIIGLAFSGLGFIGKIRSRLANAISTQSEAANTTRERAGAAYYNIVVSICFSTIPKSYITLYNP